MAKADEQIAEFSLDDFNSADTADMTVTVNGKPTTWKWTFAGPGHDNTVEQNNRNARERLQADRMKEQAIVNGKKWKAPDETVEDVRKRNIANIVERLIGWTPVKIDGELYPFSADNAAKLLIDPRKQDLYIQALEFLSSEQAFSKGSAKP
ncbi:MAG TPA: branched-chain amino acid ABC transporter [Mesorhizobium sp.]|jgi:hypothetical protein|uniref:branched-chain amino acid ABC transporter n=1 Tax=Mesorhizobium sp. TaxID=1871066 RepID=UPI002DDD2765|nr:branched-chain amino acid ABC transporter [Mesorhizobium sp.]HEV2502332.1 branched-chain amino acid ABC transporter [Mesorhizobium sp.]